MLRRSKKTELKPRLGGTARNILPATPMPAGAGPRSVLPKSPAAHTQYPHHVEPTPPTASLPARRTTPEWSRPVSSHLIDEDDDVLETHVGAPFELAMSEIPALMYGKGQTPPRTRCACSMQRCSQPFEACPSCPTSVPMQNVEGIRTGNRTVQRPAADSAEDTVRAKRRTRPAISTDVPVNINGPQSAWSTRPLPPLPALPQEAKKIIFACPFYKRDPVLYRDCGRFELRRVKDVRQHLKRKHTPIFCRRCYEVFDTEESLQAHRRSVDPCKLRPGLPPSTISDQQWDRISQQHQSRGKPLKEQWTDIWDILFPGQPQPPSIYIDSYLEEVVAQLRTFWTLKRADISAHAIQNASPCSMAEQEHLLPIFDHLVECFLGHFGAGTLGSFPSSITKLETMSEVSPLETPGMSYDDDISLSSRMVSDSPLTIDPDDASYMGGVMDCHLGASPFWVAMPDNTSPLDRSWEPYQRTDSLRDSFCESNPSEYSVPLDAVEGEQMLAGSHYSMSPAMFSMAGASMPNLGYLMDVDLRTTPGQNRYTLTGGIL